MEQAKYSSHLQGVEVEIRWKGSSTQSCHKVRKAAGMMGTKNTRVRNNRSHLEGLLRPRFVPVLSFATGRICTRVCYLDSVLPRCFVVSDVFNSALQFDTLENADFM